MERDHQHYLSLTTIVRSHPALRALLQYDRDHAAQRYWAAVASHGRGTCKGCERADHVDALDLWLGVEGYRARGAEPDALLERSAELLVSVMQRT
jgi:hypothetical protein